MKKMLLIAAAALAAVSCGQKNEYTVKVTVDSAISEIVPDSTMFVLASTSRDTVGVISDTAYLANGAVVFKGTVSEPDMVRVILKAGENRRDMYETILLENAEYELTVVSDPNNDRRPYKFVHTAIGGVLQSASDALSARADSIREALGYDKIVEKFLEARQKNDNEAAEAAMTAAEEVMNTVEAAENEYYEANPTSVLTIINTLRNANSIKLDSLKTIVETLEKDAEAAAGKYTKKIKEVFEKRAALAPGNQAPDFTLNDPEGNPVKFSEVYPKNKITMIDFWASWCGPCRRFNPTLTKIYAKFKDKGFGILGVSLDRDKESWIKAIEDDKLVWMHVSDLKYWDSEAGRLYNINAIPASVLVDSNGKILAGSGEVDLEEFLSENL